MTAPTAFIFDLDGVITDTAEFHFLAWKKLAEEEGIPFTREDNEQLRGVDRRESLRRLLKGRSLTEDQMQAWMTRKNDYYREYLTTMTPENLLPGAGEFLHEARALGLKLGIGSASKNAQDVIDRLGIFDLLDAIGDGHCVTNSKPAPDLFIWVAGRLNTPPAQVVIFEDAEAGVEAAQRGGMFSVGFGPVERVGKADLVVPGFDGLRVNAVLKALPAAPR